jgi:predicted DNA-binding ribbon-helix-helix protein
LEDEFWDSVKRIAKARGQTIAELVSEIDAKRAQHNLSSAVRLFVLEYYWSLCSRDQTATKAGEDTKAPNTDPAA